MKIKSKHRFLFVCVSMLSF